MLYPKKYLSGNDIDLSKYNLDKVRQIKVHEFMEDYDLIDFVKPFYLEQSLDLNEEIKKNKMHFTCYYLLSQEDNRIIGELIKSLDFLYQLDIKVDEVGNYINLENHVSIANVEDNLVLILKRNNQPFAFIDDSNFNILSQVILEMCHFDKPKPEKEVKGDPELIEKMKKAREKYEKKHGSKNSTSFEEVVRQVMYMRKITFNEIKDWTIWQLKDVYIVETLMESSNLHYLLASNPNYSIDLKTIQDWKKITKLVRK